MSTSAKRTSGSWTASTRRSQTANRSRSSLRSPAAPSVLRYGVCILPEHRWDDARPIWQRAEELGFDHAWTYDHLTWQSFRDKTWFGSIPTLAAASAVTSRIRLGTLVASPNFRHPVPFAKEIMTLDDISSGRLTVGLGAGGTGWDSTVLGEAWSARERADRFEEFVQILDLLLREPEASFDGRFYSAHDARNYPGCVQQPRVPFAIAAVGPRAMRSAVEHALTWVTVGDRKTEGKLSPEASANVVREQCARLDEACEQVGRDPSTLDRLVLTGLSLADGLTSADAFGETEGGYAEVGVTDIVVHWPRRSAPYEADIATFERIFPR